MPRKASYRNTTFEARDETRLPGWVLQLVACLFLFAVVLGATNSPSGSDSWVVEMAKYLVEADLTYEQVQDWAGGAAAAVARLFDLDLETFWAETVTGKPTEPSWPALGPVISPFGWRANPDSAGLSLHQGIDIQMPSESEIRAILPGVVASVRTSPAYGQVVELDHGNGLVSRYARLKTASVSEGSRVKKGEVLGILGQEQMGALPHLHFEIAKDGLEIDPLSLLPPVSKGP